MKKIFLSCFICLLFSCCMASEEMHPFLNAQDILFPLGKQGEKISLLDFSQLTIKRLESLSGHHFHITEKIGFKLIQYKLRKCINPDKTINKKKFINFFNDSKQVVHWGGYFLGFFIGLIGVLIAYLIDDDKRKRRIKWTWIGCISWLIYWTLILII